MLVAPKGIFLSDRTLFGCHGLGVIYGELSNQAIVESAGPTDFTVVPFSRWDGVSTGAFLLRGGAGGGGQGGDGHLIPAEKGQSRRVTSSGR